MKTKPHHSHRTPKLPLRIATLGLVIFTSATNVLATILPQRLASASLTTGLVIVSDGNRGYMGTGVVVSHPRVLLTCAHTTYKNRWIPAAQVGFLPGLHSAGLPNVRANRIRGYYKFANYHLARTFNEQRNMDILAAYGFANLAGGRYARAWGANAGDALRSGGISKFVLGYPHNHTQNFFQHYIGPAYMQFQTVHGSYLTVNGVATYSGASGGPVFAYFDQWYVAGVQITSNGSSYMGVRALDANGMKLISMAANTANH